MRNFKDFLTEDTQALNENAVAMIKLAKKITKDSKRVKLHPKTVEGVLQFLADEYDLDDADDVKELEQEVDSLLFSLVGPGGPRLYEILNYINSNSR